MDNVSSTMMELTTWIKTLDKTLKQGITTQFSEMKDLIAQLHQTMTTVGAKVTTQDACITQLSDNVHTHQDSIVKAIVHDVLMQLPSSQGPSMSTEPQMLCTSILSTIEELHMQVSELRLNATQMQDKIIENVSIQMNN